ncbi:hypothetical protein ACFSTD_05930 [Novosphingobium colocasiae]
MRIGLATQPQRQLERRQFGHRHRRRLGAVDAALLRQPPFQRNIDRNPRQRPRRHAQRRRRSGQRAER